MIQLGVAVTEGLGAGSQPEVGRAAAEEASTRSSIISTGTHMCFVTAGMGGGTGTGAAPVIARAAREKGILTVGVVTKPFHFEGERRMRVAEQGIEELQKCVDTLIVIPNQNLFRIANEKTTFADAFAMADQVLYSGVACITDLMVKEGLINLDFADVRSVMREMGKAMMGTGEASGEGRAIQAAEAAIANPLLDETSMKGAKGLLISITGGHDLTLFEVDEAATRIREEVDPDANIILGATFDETLEGVIRVSVVATGIDNEAREDSTPAETRMAELSQRLRTATPTAAPARFRRRPQGRSPRRPAAAAHAQAAPRPAAASPPPTPAAIARRMPRGGRLAAARAGDAPRLRRHHRAVRAGRRRYATPRSTSRWTSRPSTTSRRQRGPFIPPRPKRRRSRMPRVEDFPPVVQRQIEAARRPRRRRTRTAGRSACSAAWPMSASAAARKSRADARPSAARPPPAGASRAAAAPAAAASAQSCRHRRRQRLCQAAAGAASRDQRGDVPAAAGRSRPAWPAAARSTRTRTTSSKFRPSCAARPTETRPSMNG